MLLTALSATPGEPFTATPVGLSQLAAAVGMLRGIPAEQLLEVAIAKLPAALPAEAKVPPVAPIKFHIVSLPRRNP